MTNPGRLNLILIASVLALLTVTVQGAGQKNDQAQMLLEQAQQKELIDGQPEETSLSRS